MLQDGAWCGFNLGEERGAPAERMPSHGRGFDA
jgi:hypothetical protein